MGNGEAPFPSRRRGGKKGRLRTGDVHPNDHNEDAAEDSDRAHFFFTKRVTGAAGAAPRADLVVPNNEKEQRKMQTKTRNTEK